MCCLKLTERPDWRRAFSLQDGGMKEKQAGFSLIEMLMVLGVMAILMGMLVPSVGVVREKAQRMATGQKLRQIGLAVATYQSLTGRSLSGSDLGDWMARLAAETGVREADLYLFEEDPLLAQVAESIPPVLVQPGSGSAWEPVAGFENWPIGVAVVSGSSTASNPSTTPVAWTRGLGTDGRWAAFGEARPGVYGEQGGFIVYLDGHVEFFRDLSRDGGQLVNFADGRPTANIIEAIGPNAIVYDYIGRVF